MSVTDFESVHPTYEERVDIGNIKIDMTPSLYERAGQFLRQIENPYAFRCGEVAVNVAVNVAFCSEGKLLKETVISYLSVQKKNGWQ
ncbi:MAG: hypothetical protein A2Y17_05855 [Clostridiales bacterium GWF2_38_85]|nr:MAG: hypothetical protein A2Y17_05855 [Clostridiales bacterium GWF2_38_85]HBL84561.1 hypothetical protein [Clostridiales bacterium]